MKKLTGVLVAVVLMWGVLVAAVFAQQQNYRCGPAYGNQPVRAYLHENIEGDTSQDDDRLAVCGYASIPNLVTLAHTPPGTCAGWGITINDNWDNCISSWTVIIPFGKTACLYDNTNYVNLINFKTGPVNDRFSVVNDKASSFRIVGGGSVDC